MTKKLALEMASLGFAELTRKEIEARMQAITAGLSRFDALMVRDQAAAIARERAAAMTREATALRAFGTMTPQVPPRREALAQATAQEASEIGWAHQVPA